MSCADVMYQPYSPYFPYHQRTTDYRKFVKSHTDTSPSSLDPTPAGSPECRTSVAEEGGKEKATEAQYLSANCVLFTYYSGDISSVVDEHFARALSSATYAASPEPKAKGDGPPMSHRNFPPSFWNSNYQPMSNATMGPPGGLTGLPPDLTYGADPYHHHPGSLHATLHQGDPWGHYPTGHHFGHYPGMSHSGASRFAPNYSSLLLQPRSARLGPAAAACASLEKAESWGSSRYHDPIMDSNYGAAYGAMTDRSGRPSMFDRWRHR